MTQTFTRLSSALALTFLVAGAAQAATLLTAENGMTLYIFDKDKGGVSACYDACAVMWPPYAAKAGEKKGEGWTTVERKDKSLQWAYDGKPMYFFKGDTKAGDKKGDGMKGVWHVIME